MDNASENKKLCKYCQSEIPKKAKVCPNCKRKQGGVLKWVLIILGVLILLSLLFGGGDDSDNSSSSGSNDTKTEERELSTDELKTQCEELPYKDVARNPNNYIGKHFKTKVYIEQVINQSVKAGSEKHYKAYVYDDEMGMEDYSQFLWIYDFQKEDSAETVNILEGDVLEVYGKFEGMGQTQNSITDETSEDIALDVYYVELISE